MRKIHALYIEDEPDDYKDVSESIPEWLQLDWAKEIPETPIGGYDFVILDACLPGSDGAVETIARYKDSGIGLPFVIISGKTGFKERLKAVSLGAEDFISKSCDPEETASQLHVSAIRIYRQIGERLLR